MNNADLEKGLMACVHCGFCLPACPTYVVTGDEADSPRGRIVLMRGAHEGTVDLASPDAQADGGAGYHLDRCLGCRACETACPSGVPYGHLLEHFRNEQETESGHTRPVGERVLRGGLLATLTDPRRMTLALRAGRLTGGNVPGPVAKFLGLPTDTKVPIPEDLAQASAPMPEVTRAQGETRGRVALLSGCVMRVLYGPVHHATARVLAANGIETVCPPNQSCCGALHGHQGRLDDAKRMAKNVIAEFDNDDYDALILNSAGCGSFLKDYGHLLQDEPGDWPARALAFSAKVKDITEYLHALGPLRPMPNALLARVTYHDACHLAHGQKITDAPRALLQQIPGVEFVECVQSDLCCGSAGVYNFLEPEMARALQARKVENLLATNADVIATGNPGCLAWIKQGLEKAGGAAPEIVHPIELLDRAYHG